MNREDAGNVAEYLLAGKDNGQVALRLLHGDHTYGELRCAVDSVARHLLGQQVEKGDRAILIAENSLLWVAAYLGTLRAGLVTVPLPISLGSEELAAILTITGARVAFVQPGFLRKHPGLFDGIHVVTAVEDLRASAELGNRPAFSVEPDDLAALMFTSGSTGTPRGVMVSHRNITANTESIIEYLGLTARDRIMDVLPFHYCFGASLLHTHLRVGGTIVIDSRFLYPEAVLQRMKQTECTGFAGVPSHFQILLRNSTLAKTSFPHLRYVQQAGGRLAPGFIRELRDALPNTEVFIMYGQTEATARLSYLPPEYLDRKPGSVGMGIPEVRLSVLNESGAPVQPGETGEIVAEGANVAAGYWRAPQESALVFRNGKLYTGDRATVDEDGFIFIVDRAKDMIKCGGERVSCRKLEESLVAFDGIQEAAVIGAPDDVLGEAVEAFVVPRERVCGLDCEWPRCQALQAQLGLFCKQHLAAHLVPRKIVLIPELPKNSSGKVLKPLLRG
jgi:long-chain acyl-CoA synthetase